ncbi:MAG: hypothetical protein D6731_13950 [Planctomycetota bacterium]|nr:MAG: hypothetical protein D6731_13950 [Planctomycetota bacterium]
MRARGVAKAGLVELVLWDVVLLALVGGLYWADGRLAEGAASSPVSPTPAAAPGEDAAGRSKHTATAPERAPPPARPPAPRSTAGPRPERPAQEAGEEAMAKEDQAAVLLSEVERRAEAALDRGEAEAALDALRDAPPWVRAERRWAELRARVEAAAETADRALCLRLDLRLAADAGNVPAARALLALLPPDLREALADEGVRAERHAPEAVEEGLAIRGFSPDRIRLDGVRCSIDCTLARERASTLLNGLDRLAELAEEFLDASAGHVVVRLLEADDAPARPAPEELFLYRRSGEPPRELDLRLRLALARRLVRAAAGPSAVRQWVYALADALAGAEADASRRPRCNALGAARRRLFHRTPPDGTGTVLLRTVGGEEDPARAGAWALAHYALFASSPGARELWRLLRKELRAPGALAAEITPVRAAGLEPGWLEFLEAR